MTSRILTIMIALACFGMVACGGNNDNGSSISDSTAPRMQELDSVRNDTANDSSANRVTGSANDSVKRPGGSSTSTGDSGSRP